MPESNADRARRGFAAVSRGDLDTLRELLDPDVSWHGGDPDAPGACHDSDEVVEFIRHAGERGGIGELIDVVEAGDRVVVVMRAAEPGGGGRDELRANVTTFRDGKVVEMVAYETPEAALAAVRG